MDVEGLLKDLANCKLQLEAKDSAQKQALLKLDHYQKIADELSTLLKQSEDERGKYVEECTEARTCIDVLKSKLKEMADQLAETARLREQLLHVLNELKAAQEELLSMETELAAARGLQLKAMTQAELMESAAGMEKDKSDMLSRHVSELNEALFKAELVAIEAHGEKCKILSEKDAELEVAKAKAAKAEEQFEDLKRQLEMIQELEIELLEKSIVSDLLRLELEQSIEMLSSSDKSDVIKELKQVKEEMEVKERRNLVQAFRIESMETELHQLKLEVKNANEEMDSLKSNAEMLTDLLQRAKTEMDEVRKKENVAKAEIVESALINTRVEFQQVDELENVTEEIREDQNGAFVVISAEEYDLLVKKAAKADEVSMALVECYPIQLESKDELETSKKKLEGATAKIRELRNRVEQAMTRADAAERAKAGLEDQIRRYKERKQKKSAGIVALKEVSEPKPMNFPTYEKIPATYQPLGKVLNMKF